MFHLSSRHEREGYAMAKGEMERSHKFRLYGPLTSSMCLRNCCRKKDEATAIAAAIAIAVLLWKHNKAYPPSLVCHVSTEGGGGRGGERAVVRGRWRQAVGCS